MGEFRGWSSHFSRGEKATGIARPRLVLGGQEPSRPAQSEGSGMPVSNQPPLGDVLEPLDLGGWGGRRFGRSGRRRGAGQGRLDATLFG
jgi:hypothetical protein